MTLKKISMLTALVLPTIAFAQITPAAPASVDTNAEKAAWEALMSPVGEYAAYATYDAILKKYGNLEPYATILRSEQQHINALSRQLQRYGVTVPANPYLGKITLPADLNSVAKAEAQTEVDNAGLYDRLMSMASGDAQLTRVFTNLQRASRDVHLPLFTKAAAGNGTLSAADMTAFHTQNMNQMGQGQGGNGQGQGYGQNQQLGRNQNQSGLNQRNGMGQNGQRGYGQGQNQSRGQGMGMQQGQGGTTMNCPMQGQGHGHGGHGPGWKH